MITPILAAVALLAAINLGGGVVLTTLVLLGLIALGWYFLPSPPSPIIKLIKIVLGITAACIFV